MRNRWLIYIIVGLCFGIIDWYFLDFLASSFALLGQNESVSETAFLLVLMIAVFITLNYGIWLVPVIPTAIFEVRRSHSLWKATLASALIWVTAIFSYYTFYTFLLMFVGLPHLEFMLFSNLQSATYWADWWLPFRRVVLDQFFDWIGIAVLGGVIIGALGAHLFNVVSKRRGL